MKKLKWLQKVPAPIPVVCYGVTLVCYLVACLFGLCADGLAKANGSLRQTPLAVSDFSELPGLVQLDETSWVTTDGDPQMVWYNTQKLTVRSLWFAPEYDREPREICLYYTTKEEEAFSLNKRVFASQNNDGSYLFTLPRANITALRLDPSSPVEEKMVTMTLAQPLQLNLPTPWYNYFAPGWAGAFYLMIYPGLAAAALSLARQALVWYNSKKKPA